MCIAGTHSIDVRNTDDLSESSVLTYGWTPCAHTTDDTLRVLMKLTEQGDSPTTLRLLSGSALTESRDLHLPAGCTDLMLGKNYVYGFSGFTIVGLPISGGKTVSWSLPYAAESVLCRLDGTRALLSAEGKVYLVELP